MTRFVPLGRFAEINPAANKNMSPGLCCSFVPMDAIDDRQGVIAKRLQRKVGEVQKGYTPFQEQDVLFAKITPCMENGKCAVAANLTNGVGYGSTEFHVIRVKDGILPKWIYYYLRQERTRRLAERNMTGSAGQKRVPARFLEELQLPLPSLTEQERLCQILDKADRLRRTRRYVQQLSDTFFQSVFLDMFGNPLENSKGWDIVELAEIGDLDRGRSKHRPRNAPELLGGKYPLIQTGDVANAGGYIRSYKQTYSDIGLKQSKLWPKGTMCITIAANIGKTAILTFDACFPDSVVGFTPNTKTIVEYIQSWFRFVQKHLEDTAPESAQKNINLEILRELKVPLPPIALQEKFATAIRKAERLRQQQDEARRQAEQLFQSLLRQAFERTSS